MKYTYFCVMQKSIPFKNARVFYTDEGTGRAILLIHGFLENHKMWNAIVPHLTQRNRVITVDLPGHGASDCMGYVHSMELLAEATNEVLKHLRVRKCILIGHSLGGYVSLAFAELFSEKVKGLCLMNSNAHADSEERIAIRNRAISLAQKQYENLIRMSFLNLFDPETKGIIQKARDEALQEALKTPVQGYIAMQEGMKLRPNRCYVLQKATYKKLYIIGNKDPIFKSNISVQEAKINKAECVVFPNGHMSHIENTTELIDTLSKFCKGL